MKSSNFIQCNRVYDNIGEIKFVLLLLLLLLLVVVVVVVVYSSSSNRLLVGVI